MKNLIVVFTVVALFFSSCEKSEIVTDPVDEWNIEVNRDLNYMDVYHTIASDAGFSFNPEYKRTDTIPKLTVKNLFRAGDSLDIIYGLQQEYEIKVPKQFPLYHYSDSYGASYTLLEGYSLRNPTSLKIVLIKIIN